MNTDPGSRKIQSSFVEAGVGDRGKIISRSKQFSFYRFRFFMASLSAKRIHLIES